MLTNPIGTSYNLLKRYINRLYPKETMTVSAKVAYARVSTSDQNLARQLEALKAYEPDKIFTDEVSGKNLERPGFNQMLEYVREGDMIYVCSLDRLARNLNDLLETIKGLQERGVSIHFLKENILISSDIKTSSMSKLILSIMGAVAEFERSLIRERQQEGIDLAKKRGVYKGRAPIAEDRIAKAKELYGLGVPISKISKQLKIGRSTLYRRVVGLKTDST